MNIITGCSNRDKGSNKRCLCNPNQIPPTPTLPQHRLRILRSQRRDLISHNSCLRVYLQCRLLKTIVSNNMNACQQFTDIHHHHQPYIQQCRIALSHGSKGSVLMAAFVNNVHVQLLKKDHHTHKPEDKTVSVWCGVCVTSFQLSCA